MDQAQREARMAEIYRQYAGQPVLRRIAEGRRLVPGHGPLDAPLMVVGEAPGEQEDKRGVPFTGPAGKLLQKLFAGAGLPWDCCYVTNVLPWRPPGNRDPYPFEVQAAEARLEREAALVDPLVVVAAGAVAWRGLTRSELGPFATEKLKWRELGGRRFIGIPHPSFIMRLGGAERPQWERAVTEALAMALAAA
jgi:uracil-DNA glycosylase family 4